MPAFSTWWRALLQATQIPGPATPCMRRHSGERASLAYDYVIQSPLGDVVDAFGIPPVLDAAIRTDGLDR